MGFWTISCQINKKTRETQQKHENRVECATWRFWSPAELSISEFPYVQMSVLGSAPPPPPAPWGAVLWSRRLDVRGPAFRKLITPQIGVSGRGVGQYHSSEFGTAFCSCPLALAMPACPRFVLWVLRPGAESWASFAHGLSSGPRRQTPNHKRTCVFVHGIPSQKQIVHTYQ